METPLYNSRITDAYLKLIKKRYPYVNRTEVLKYAGMKDYEIADQAHWFTREQVVRLHEKLVQVTGNANISREAGRYAASVDALGVLRQYILGFIGAAHFFELWTGKTAANLTRSAVYQSRKLAPNKVEVVVAPVREGVEEPFQCQNRIGFFEAIVFMYTRKMPTVHHPECMFAGGKVCRYEISWVNSWGVFLKMALNIVTPVLILLNLALVAANQWIARLEFLERSLLISLIIELILAVAAAYTEKKDLLGSLKNAVETKDTLLEQININYNNAQMTNEIGQGLGTFTNTEEIFSNLIGIMQKRLNYDRGLVFLADSTGTKLVLQTGYGFAEEEMQRFKRLAFRLNRPSSKGVFVRAFREQTPFLINNLSEIEDSLSRRSMAFAKKIGTISFICCPIICEGKSVGIVAVDNVKNKQPLVESDVSLLMGIASVIGISIRNAELIEERVRVFKSMVQVLAASIDARDPLTAGHSEKVTEYSVGICKELGLQPDFCEVIRVAALLHDYGKIGVPDTILKKQGRLTPEEYEVVKAHSRKTTEILAKINFEGSFCKVPEIAGSHHEKVDGSGYPNGLKGAKIPLGARIIAVADYFEAITAKRHYRDPMPVDEAFALLRQAAGAHLEVGLVEALIAFYVRSYPEAVKWSGAEWEKAQEAAADLQGGRWLGASLDREGGVGVAQRMQTRAE